jgi:hypothetical protein
MASMAEELSGQAAQLSETMSFFKLGTNAATIARGPKHEVHVAHAKTGIATTKATPTAAVTAPSGAGTPSRITAISLAKRESTTDSDFEEF